MKSKHPKNRRLTRDEKLIIYSIGGTLIVCLLFLAGAAFFRNLGPENWESWRLWINSSRGQISIRLYGLLFLITLIVTFPKHFRLFSKLIVRMSVLFLLFAIGTGAVVLKTVVRKARTNKLFFNLKTRFSRLFFKTGKKRR